uniref:Peroxisomal multifunctional enzyme type 2-like N-terminal domain-containing protein n=1 Tax=Timema genevievae TaxID=629358 RepID=A0A7R9JQH1_TIMGE|nr:unnamed protein product [Timema genevievae]
MATNCGADGSIFDWSDFEADDVSATLTVALEEMKANAQSDSLSKVVTNSLSYDKRDIILYSLGVGASLDNPEDLKYLYEGHEAFSALPTFLIIPAITTLLGANIIGDVFPGKDIDLTKMLHGEQYLEVIRPLETSGELVSKARVVDVLDKGSGAAILVDEVHYGGLLLQSASFLDKALHIIELGSKVLR